MVSFTSFFAAAVLCAAVANAAPVPGNATPTKSSSSTSCTTTSTKAKAKAKATSTSCSTSSSSTSTSCSTSSTSTSTPCTTSSTSTSTSCTTSSTSTSTSCTTSSTSSAMMTYSTPSYGSGMSNWGGYNDCVSQCIAKNGGMKMGSYQKPTATMESMSMGSKGTGATHTVIVAPSQGVLRYVPMAVNASVGDTIKFMWGANNHTVTKGSQLEPCNKTKDAFFTSGSHDKGFIFTQVVNDTKPTFFFCNTPGHCQKGMFGIINPANNFGSPSCAKNVLTAMKKNSSTLASMDTYMNMMDKKSPAAMNWGNNLDMNGVPSWAQESMGENIMFTRNFLAANPEVMDSTGKVDLGKAGDAPFVIPKDLAAAPTSFAAAASSAAVDKNGPIASIVASAIKPAFNAISSAAPGAVTSTSASAVPSSTGKSSGALSVRSSAGLVGAVAALAAFVTL